MKKKSLLVLFLILAIGFASVATTLYINGSATFSTNKNDFNVKFTEADASEENKTSSKTNEKATAVIESDEKNITFNTQDLAVVGEWARVDYEITNFSKNYDANVTVSWEVDDEDDEDFVSEYLTIETQENWDGVIPAGARKTGWVKVSVKKAYLGSGDLNDPKEIGFTVTYKADAVDRTELGSDVPAKLAAGFYDDNDQLVLSWEDSQIDVTSNYTSQTYKTSANSAYTITRANPTATKLVLPKDITKIGEYALADATNLKVIELKEGLTNIEKYAFFGCEGLTSLEIPYSVSFIGQSAFMYCTKLETINVPKNVPYIEAYTFNECTNLKNVKLSNGLVGIDETSFSNCKNLESIVIPDTVRYVWNYAFKGCSNLKDVTLSSNLTYIGTWTFQGCTSLESVTFKNPNNWYVGTSMGDTATLISSTDLSNPSSAATLLNTTHYTKYWTHSE